MAMLNNQRVTGPYRVAPKNANFFQFPPVGDCGHPLPGGPIVAQVVHLCSEATALLHGSRLKNGEPRLSRAGKNAFFCLKKKLMLFCVFQNCCGIFSCLIFISGTPKEKRVCWMILSDSNLVYRSGFFWEPKICRFSCEFDLKLTPISGFNIFVPYNFKNIDCVFIYLFSLFIYLLIYLYIHISMYSTSDSRMRIPIAILDVHSHRNGMPNLFCKLSICPPANSDEKPPCADHQQTSNGYYKSLWTIGWLAPINGY